MDSAPIFSKNFNDELSGHESGASAIHDTLFMQILDRVYRLKQPDTPVDIFIRDYVKRHGEVVKTSWFYDFETKKNEGSIISIYFEFNDRDEPIYATVSPRSFREQLSKIKFTDPDALVNEKLHIIKTQPPDAGATFKHITCAIDGYTIKNIYI